MRLRAQLSVSPLQLSGSPLVFLPLGRIWFVRLGVYLTLLSARSGLRIVRWRACLVQLVHNCEAIRLSGSLSGEPGRLSGLSRVLLSEMLSRRLS